ncbi:hypothetical protein QR680_018392 [Steinernema hermaphroditum]|uniref:Uncharacterized protein n=1 Tax=Steinernema hermaphroditum TaxID=289476 RepID=A0AA39LR18_9BILA|nr:hypothetical protein QR680_018392 [Steinernema hermaphroditum]
MVFGTVIIRNQSAVHRVPVGYFEQSANITIERVYCFVQRRSVSDIALKAAPIDWSLNSSAVLNFRHARRSPPRHLHGRFRLRCFGRGHHHQFQCNHHVFSQYDRI